jgi:PleD family two-component response regulator
LLFILARDHQNVQYFPLINYIVDDNQSNLLLLERVLQQAGYRHYTSLSDSRQFLDQFRMFQPTWSCST